MSFRSSAGTGDRADADAELLADDVREARLAEARRADEENVVERVAARLRRGERDRELLLHALLADEVGEAARPQRLLELLLFLCDHRCQELRAHAALSARAGRAPPVRLRIDIARACSASTSE